MFGKYFSIYLKVKNIFLTLSAYIINHSWISVYAFNFTFYDPHTINCTIAKLVFASCDVTDVHISGGKAT